MSRRCYRPGFVIGEGGAIALVFHGCRSVGAGDHCTWPHVSPAPPVGDAKLRAATAGDGANTGWWLRLKGARDIVSGLMVLALMAWGGSSIVGIALIVEALIPLGDMSLILSARGSVARAFAIHGLTAFLMIAAAVPLLMGWS